MSFTALAQNHRHSEAGVSAAKQQSEWGTAGDPKAVKRTVKIVIAGNVRFTPDTVDMKQDEKEVRAHQPWTAHA
ncbi:MAG: hypothetical protein H7255_18555 [Ramlibacter sp.]|nr:hypothetical protein [Ramlibacter sp.]